MESRSLDARPARRRTLLVLALLAVGGCGGDDGGGMGPDPDPTVTITPSAVAMIVGDTASVSATVTGSTASPTYTSSATGVATVDGSGKLTAVGEGTATVSASVGSVSAEATITVGPSNPTLEIAAITQNGQTVDPQNLSGIVDVAIDYDGFPNTASGVIEVTLGGVVVGSAAFPASSAAVAAGGGGGTRVSGITGRVDARTVTNAIDVIGADEIAARTGNGLQEMLAQVPGVVVSQPQEVNVQNTARVFLRGLSSDRNVVINGTPWGAGNTVAQVQPVPVDLREIESIEILVDGTGAQTVPTIVRPATRVGDTDVFEVSLSAELTAGLETSLAFTGARVRYTDASEEAQLVIGGPEYHESSPSTTFHIDQVAGTSTLSGYTLQRPWFGSGIDASAAFDRLGVRWTGENATHVDRGVGGLDPTLLYGSSYGNLAPYTTSDAVTETSSLSNVFAIDWVDAIGNTRREEVRREGGQPLNWGFDGVPPSLTRVAGSGYLGRRNNDPVGLTFAWTGTDSGSGLSGNAYGRLRRWAVGTGEEGECLYGDDASCGFVRLDLSAREWNVLDLSTDHGYYQAEVQEADSADNLSPSLSVRWALGGDLPLITNFQAPTSVTGGTEITWGGDASDDVEVRAAEWSLKFGSWTQRIGKRLTVSAGYDSDVVTSTSLSESVYGYSSIEATDSNGVPSGTVYGLTELGLAVTDASGQTASQAQSVEGNVAGLSLTSRYGAISDRLHVSGPTLIEYNKDGSVNPLSTGHFAVEAWAQDISTFSLAVRLALVGTSPLGYKILYPIGEELERNVQDNGGWYSIHYQQSVDFAQIAGLRALKISGYVAIGADDDGNGLVSNERALTVNLKF